MQLQRLALRFGPAASLHWDLTAFSAANRESSTSADPAQAGHAMHAQAANPDVTLQLGKLPL